MPTKTPRDPLYYHARRAVLHANDTGISHLQRRLRIGYQHAIDLRHALRGDVLEHQADTDTWHIRAEADRHTDFLLEEKLAQSAYPALGRQGLCFQTIASPPAFEQVPLTAWGFYGHRLNLYRATAPHAGFGVLHAWGQRMAQGCFVFTSNVDGHFQKAGFPTARVHECHGSIHRLQCTAHCSGEIWPTAHLHPQVDEAACQWQGELPHCPRCGALARPNVLMFDDRHWNDTRSQQQRMLLDMWLDSTTAPLVIEIGAGRAVPTVRNFTRRMQQRGSALVRINLREASIHNPDAIEIALGAREALERIQQHIAADM